MLSVAEGLKPPASDVLPTAAAERKRHQCIGFHPEISWLLDHKEDVWK